MQFNVNKGTGPEADPNLPILLKHSRGIRTHSGGEILQDDNELQLAPGRSILFRRDVGNWHGR